MKDSDILQKRKDLVDKREQQTIKKAEKKALEERVVLASNESKRIIKEAADLASQVKKNAQE